MCMSNYQQTLIEGRFWTHRGSEGADVGDDRGCSGDPGVAGGGKNSDVGEGRMYWEARPVQVSELCVGNEGYDR